MLNLQEFRSIVKGLPDLLPYAALVAPGVVLNKDGSFLGGWEYRGPDVASSTPEELAWLSERMNTALLQLGSGWMIHVDSIRKTEAEYMPDGAFSDPVSRLVDERRRRFFAGRHCLQTVTYLVAAYRPNFTQDKLARMASGELDDHRAVEKALATFQANMDALEDALSAALHVQRLEEYDLPDGRFSALLSHLHFDATGIVQPLRLPMTPMYLDALIGGEELVGGMMPKIGNQWIGALCLDGFPQESWPAMFSMLDSLPYPYRFSTRFIFLDQSAALKELDTYRRTWSQKVFRFIDTLFNNAGARPNREAARMVEDAEQAIAEVQSQDVGAGYLTSSIILLDEDQEELLERCREVKKVIQNLGFGCRMETINALETWLGSLPGNGYANVRRPMVNTRNLADMLPLTAAWGGLEQNPNGLFPPNSPAMSRVLTDGSTPFWFTPWESDLGHMAIFGPTGSGKSTLLAFMELQFLRYPGAQVFAFDKGMSMFAACKGVRGSHYDIGKEGSFAPLRHVDEEEERMWAHDWLIGLARLQGLTLQPSHRNLLQTALMSLAMQPEHLRSMSNFLTLLQDPEGSLKAALRAYTRDGGSDMLDAKEDAFGLGSFMVFEIEDLMNRDDSMRIPVLLYLFHKLEKAMTGRPTILVLDEAWLMLGHELFRGKIREWLKVLRKKVCSVWMATQSLSDAANSGIWDVLMESCPVKILLANNEAKQTGREFYERAGLNKTELDLISSAIPKRDYYMIHPQGRRLIQLALDPVTLAFVGASDPKSIARIRELEATTGEWWKEWIRERTGEKEWI